MGQYTIQIASKLSGVGVHTMRAWEKRYKAVVPKRNDSGRRLYSDQDVEKLKLLFELSLMGSSISSIAGLEISQLQSMLGKLGSQSSSPDSIQGLKPLAKESEIQSSLQNLLLALRFYKLDAISHEIRKITLSTSPRQLALDILIPLLTEVGEQVCAEKLNVAQEHALSAILKFHIGPILYKNYNARPKKQSFAVLATPEDDYHEFGVLLAGLLCCHHGVKFYYLGANLPHQSLNDAINSLQPNLVILGAGPFFDHSKMEILDNYLTAVLNQLGPKEQLWLGGRAVFSQGKISQQYQNFRFFKGLQDLDMALEKLL